MQWKQLAMRKKEMIQLTDKENKSYEKQKICYKNKNDENGLKLYHKVRDHCHYTRRFRGAAHSIWNLRYKLPKTKIPVVFHNGSIYKNHFKINQLAKEFDGQLECLGENTYFFSIN